MFKFVFYKFNTIVLLAHSDLWVPPEARWSVRVDGNLRWTCDSLKNCFLDSLAWVQDCMVGLLFAFMPVLANNRSGGDVDHFDVLRLLFRSVPALS